MPTFLKGIPLSTLAQIIERSSWKNLPIISILLTWRLAYNIIPNTMFTLDLNNMEEEELLEFQLYPKEVLIWKASWKAPRLQSSFRKKTSPYAHRVDRPTRICTISIVQISQPAKMQIGFSIP